MNQIVGCRLPHPVVSALTIQKYAVISGTLEWPWRVRPGKRLRIQSPSRAGATTTLVAIAEQKKLISTEQRVKFFFPDFPDERVKLSHLLNHSSGLAAWLSLHSHFHDENGLGSFNPQTTPREARRYYENEIIKSYDQEAAKRFEKQVVYSDLGFMLLAWALGESH